MKLRKILKKTKEGGLFLEITSETIADLERVLGEGVILETEEVWIYSKTDYTCTLARLGEADWERVKSAISPLALSNKAPNREH